MQSKLGSLIEAGTNTLIGLVLALAVNMVLMRFAGVTATTGQNVVIVVGHTLVSVVRSYVVRRFFNGEWCNRMKVNVRNGGLLCCLQGKLKS